LKELKHVRFTRAITYRCDLETFGANKAFRANASNGSLVNDELQAILFEDRAAATALKNHSSLT
jgi:hypothetical protein